MEDNKFTAVLSPFRIGDVELKNRVVRTAQATGLATDGFTDDFVAYHTERARGGVGLTILEATSVHPSAFVRTGTRSWDDAVIHDYSRLKEAVAPYEMPVFVQLFHGGFTAHNSLGGPPWSASAVANPATGVPAIPMTIDQIDEIIEAFVSAARRVVEGGLDGIEVHAGHGYLIEQFLSPVTNRRSDEYGGDPESRARLLIRILKAVRNAVSSVPVGVRVSADEQIKGGLTSDDMKKLILQLESQSLIDFVDLTLGMRHSYTKIIGGMDEPQGYELPFSIPIASEVEVPSIVVGRIKSLAHADEIVREGKADLVGMVRATIADPELIRKAIQGDEERIRPCIACNQGCLGGLVVKSVGCAVNPSAGRELEVPPLRTIERRDGASGSVVVVGGGPAGMEAARTSAMLGMRVVLFEKSDNLGGQVELARRGPHRSEIGDITDYLKRELHSLGVDVNTGVDASPSTVDRESPDIAIIATGSVPRHDFAQIMRPLTELLNGEGCTVLSSWEVMTGDVPRESQVTVFDDVGHHEAISVVEILANEGNQVTFVTSLPAIGARLAPARADEAAKRRLASLDVDVLTDFSLVGVSEQGVSVEPVYGERQRVIESSHLVPILLNTPMGGAMDWTSLALPTLTVGDALSPRFLDTAISEGNDAGRRAWQILSKG